MGASLAFAVGAEPPLRNVRVTVNGRPISRSVAVDGTPGKERPLSLLYMLEQPGRHEVTVTFDEEPVVLTHEIHAEAAP